jgi:hypothetical protein
MEDDDHNIQQTIIIVTTMFDVLIGDTPSQPAGY